MRVKNKYQSHLGFGTERILPDETKPLPRGYDANHPVVKFYLSKDWLEIVGDNSAEKSAPPVNVSIKTGDDAERITDKPLDRMNKEELQGVALERGVKFDEADTKQVLIEKIKTAQTDKA